MANCIRKPIAIYSPQCETSITKGVSRILNGFNSRCLHVITGEEYRVTAVSPAYNLLLYVRQRRLRYLGHLLRIPHDSVVRRTLIAMAGGGNRYPEESLFMDCQDSELNDLETLAVNRTAWTDLAMPTLAGVNLLQTLGGISLLLI